jgi:NNP family nitrate/nitrite transporter-like MFS transporter
MAISSDAIVPVATTVGAGRGARWIDHWYPEDEVFWEREGRQIARRNLVFSILSEHIGFSIWSLWSILVLFLGPEFGFDPGQKFLLTTVPTAVGGLMRLPYTLAVARFGGRNWTVISAAALVIPCIATALVLEPGVSFTTLLCVAGLAGVGGGNFASSMANIDSFYPQRLKGWALGLNAGGGNLGVPVVHLDGLAVLATVGSSHPRVLVGVYAPLIVIAALTAALRMDNLTCAVNDRRAMREVCREPHAWVMALLYIGCFGSFIGFSFAFGQVLQVQFATTFDTPIKAAYVTFLGPLLGSLARPFGGKLADRHGGARVTAITFVAMAVGAGVVLAASLAGSLPMFLIGFVTLFLLTGLANGSTYKMIPAIMIAKARRLAGSRGDLAAHTVRARRLTRALIGIIGAVGTLGGVAVNLALRQSFLSSKSGDAAYIGFIAFYLLCVGVVWAVYLRPSPSRLEGI